MKGAHKALCLPWRVVNILAVPHAQDAEPQQSCQGPAHEQFGKAVLDADIVVAAVGCVLLNEPAVADELWHPLHPAQTSEAMDVGCRERFSMGPRLLGDDRIALFVGAVED